MKRTKRKKNIFDVFQYSINTDLDLLGYDFSIWKVICFLIGVAAAIPAFILMLGVKITFVLFMGSYLLLIIYPVINIIENIRRDRILCESVFIILASLICMLIKEYKSAVIILFGYNLLRLVETYYTDKQRLRLGTIVDVIPEDAVLVVDGKPVRRKLSRIKKGDYVGVNTRSVIPIDGIVINGSTTIDYSSVSNSEFSIPVVKGTKVYSGGFNLNDPIIIQADCDYPECFIQRILTSCQNSLDSEYDSTVVTVLRFTVPVMLLIVFIVGIVAPIFNGQWIANAKVCVFLLLICCPYGIFNVLNLTNYIAVLSFFSNGAVVSNSRMIDKLGNAGTLICNKTGTVTESDFTIEDVHEEGISVNNFLSMLLNVESISQHPIARSLRYYCGILNAESPQNMNAVEIQGNGIEADVENNRILVGNSKFLFNSGIFTRSADKPGSVVHVSVNGKYCGYILFNNKIRTTTANAIESIKSRGLKNLVLVSGDLQTYVRSLAASLGFNVVKAEIDSEEKASVTDYLMDNRAGSKTVVYVGNMLEEQNAACHADVSVATDMVRDMDNVGIADIDILSGGLHTFAQIFSVAVNKLLIYKIEIIVYLVTKALLTVLVLFNVVSIWFFALVMSIIMTGLLIFSIVRFGKEK